MAHRIALKKSAKTLGLAESLRTAIRNSGQTIYAVSKGSGVANPITLRFMSGERDIRFETAEKLCAYLGLKLVKDK